MASQIKLKVAKNLYNALHNKINIGQFDDFLGCFNLLKGKNNQIVWKADLQIPSSTSLDENCLVNSQQELIENNTVKKVTCFNISSEFSVNVEVDLKKFIKDVLDSDPTKLNYESPHKKILFEFSSPNIAKPFHVGHLRSTNIGNTLANVKKKFEHEVVKMNYLGDWGTQFGMIQLGMDLANYSEEELEKNPLKVLFKAYVKGNAEAEKDLKLYQEAKKIFFDLESEVEEITQKWNKYKEWSLKDLNAAYNRLGVSFDEVTWESDYRRKKADDILKLLGDKGILSVDDKDRTVAVLGETKIPLLKSDDTTLYILRDLMAVKDRRSKHTFDEMYYVVDNGQTEHFQKLFAISSELNLNEGATIEHIKFGKIHGMSTRKGKVVFLSDILDEAKERIYDAQLHSTRTKVSLETKDTADILGVSAVVINDLRHRRIKDYEFSWDNILNIKGSSGVLLQYCHCRLCNLETESGAVVASECDPEALLEPQAIHLIMTISKYEERLRLTNKSLEPCTLVIFLFDLIKAVNSAYKILNLKKADPHVASQRLLMFCKARQVLNEGMRLLGLTPLTKM